MPKISVIVPVYNVEPYLRQCLDSIVNQTLKDIEIILIADTESTDKSLEICYEYEKLDNRIKVIPQGHEGLGAARNLGMQFATGEYIGFVDSDDFMDLDFYEKLYNKASINNVDVCMANLKRYINEEAIIPPNYNYECRDQFENSGVLSDVAKLHLLTFRVGVWDKIYKKSFLEKNNIIFTPKLLHEDLLYEFEIIMNEPIFSTTFDVFYYWRNNKNSRINTEFDSKQAFQIFEIYSLCYQKLFSKKQYSNNETLKNIIDMQSVVQYSSFLNHITPNLWNEALECTKQELKKINIYKNPYASLILKMRYKMLINSKSHFGYKVQFTFIWLFMKFFRLSLIPFQIGERKN